MNTPPLDLCKNLTPERVADHVNKGSARAACASPMGTQRRTRRVGAPSRASPPRGWRTARPRGAGGATRRARGQRRALMAYPPCPLLDSDFFFFVLKQLCHHTVPRPRSGARAPHPRSGARAPHPRSGAHSRANASGLMIQPWLPLKLRQQIQSRGHHRSHKRRVRQAPQGRRVRQAPQGRVRQAPQGRGFCARIVAFWRITYHSNHVEIVERPLKLLKIRADPLPPLELRPLCDIQSLRTTTPTTPTTPTFCPIQAYGRLQEM